MVAITGICFVSDMMVWHQHVNDQIVNQAGVQGLVKKWDEQLNTQGSHVENCALLSHMHAHTYSSVFSLHILGDSYICGYYHKQNTTQTCSQP